MNVFFIIISILTFSLKTSNDLRVPVVNNVTSLGENGTQIYVVENTSIVSPVFFYSDVVCNAWFTITLAIRFIFSTDRSVRLLLYLLFTARCTLVQSAILRLHVVCLSVCNVGGL